jgi:anti-sigma factor RsiW
MTEDEELVALADNELDEKDRKSLLARLAQDEALWARFNALRKSRAEIVADCDSLLAEAPVTRLRAALPPLEEDPLSRLRAALPRERHRGEASPHFARVPFRAIAVAIALCMVAAGGGAWLALTLAGRVKEDWRSAVADYTNLYTNETFSPLRPDASLEALELGAVGQRVGAKLTPESVALPALRFTVAFMLSFKGSPLGAIAYVDAEGSPVMFCIIANHEPDAPLSSERRGDLALASWSRAGRSYLVIGRIPEERAVELAKSLEKRV